MFQFESIWALLTVVGPIVIAAAIAYALLKRRRLTRTEQRLQERKIEELYEDTPEQHRRAVAEAEAEERARERTG